MDRLRVTKLLVYKRPFSRKYQKHKTECACGHERNLYYVNHFVTMSRTKITDYGKRIEWY